MDTYLEHLIKQKHDIKSILITLGLYLLALILSAFVFVFALSSPLFMQFSLPVMVALFIGAWWISKQFHVEFEYIVTNDELDVDKIVAKKTRKRLVTISSKKFEIMDKAEGTQFEDSLKNPDISIKLDASLGKGSINRYYAIFENKLGKRMLLVFNPTRQMMEAFKRYNPLRVKIDD